MRAGDIKELGAFMSGLTKEAMLGQVLEDGPESVIMEVTFFGIVLGFATQDKKTGVWEWTPL